MTHTFLYICGFVACTGSRGCYVAISKSVLFTSHKKTKTRAFASDKATEAGGDTELLVRHPKRELPGPEPEPAGYKTLVKSQWAFVGNYLENQHQRVNLNVSRSGVVTHYRRYRNQQNSREITAPSHFAPAVERAGVRQASVRQRHLAHDAGLGHVRGRGAQARHEPTADRRAHVAQRAVTQLSHQVLLGRVVCG